MPTMIADDENVKTKSKYWDTTYVKNMLPQALLLATHSIVRRSGRRSRRRKKSKIKKAKKKKKITKMKLESAQTRPNPGVSRTPCFYDKIVVVVDDDVDDEDADDEDVDDDAHDDDADD